MPSYSHTLFPPRAGKPPTGYHLDVTKDEKLVQKLMIDEKKCYLFGRNEQLNDFCTDHASCSRVHAAFVYHKHLQICYLVDLGSTHGTFIGNVRLEAHKPTQLHMNSQFHFGASTRIYVLRERPSAGSRPNIMEDIPAESVDGTLLGLPESQSELDNLTEYNTATNRRISMLGITDDSSSFADKSTTSSSSGSRKRSIKNVSFNEEEIVINPEDVDPNVGRFRNMIQSTVVPVKRPKLDTSSSGAVFSAPPTFNPSLQSDLLLKQFNASLVPHLYQDLPPSSTTNESRTDSEGISTLGGSIGSKLGLLLPNPAPDVTPLYDDEEDLGIPSGGSATARVMIAPNEDERIDDEVTGDQPKKKKYAKEAWPGRKPLLSGL